MDYLDDISRAVENSLGSHLSHASAVALAEELIRLRTVEARVIELLDSPDADVAQVLYYGRHLKWNDELDIGDDRGGYEYPGGKPIAVISQELATEAAER